ncbi:MAG TPA: cache domain-containing protein, partial [Actinomycetota bacterium]|nr:cache domain-containing protein [Actinomycetota bacterium]
MIGESAHADHAGISSTSSTRSAHWAIYAVLAGLLGVLVMTGVFFARSIQLEKRDYLTQNDAIARSVAASIDAREAGYLDVLRAYNGRLPLQEAVTGRDRVQALVHLRQLRQVFPELDRTFLADPAGIVWVTEPETPKIYGKSYAFRDWYRGVSRAWRPYMSEIYRTDLGGSLAIALALPVRDRDNRVIGILASVQRLETLRQWLLPVEVPNGSLFVVDRNGQLLFHRTRTGPDHVADYAATPVARSLRQGLNGVAEMEDPVERITSLSAYRWLPTLGWGVVVQRAENLALQRTRTRIGLSALVALILTGTLAALGTVALRNERRIVAANARLRGEIAERRRAEEATAAVNRAKSEFLSRMSHELRTPLNSIIGFTELLLTSTRDTLSDRQRSALERVRESGRHLLELINEVLDLSKIEAGRMDVRAEAFELLPLVLECLGAIEPQAQAKGL